MTSEELLASLNAKMVAVCQSLKRLEEIMATAFPPPRSDPQPDATTKRGKWCEYRFAKTGLRMDQTSKKKLSFMAECYAKDLEDGKAPRGPYGEAIADYVACRSNAAATPAEGSKHGNSTTYQGVAMPQNNPDDEPLF